MIVLQLWEESFEDGSIRSDGCSLHIDKSNRDSYINSFYETRDETIPKVYERVIGEECIVEVKDDILELVKKEVNIRLSEIELNNLTNLKEIKSM